jgi:uncharacterized Zn finger protein
MNTACRGNEDVPLYEFVLRFPDRDEIRLTDRNHYRVGDEILIAGRHFRVTSAEAVVGGDVPPSALRVDERFVVELTMSKH